ncbi:O-fucosyltransferase 9 [Nymphaea colorata]|nr:O-fucosyltransferase 9 [Nymphaea colorata]
MYAYSRLGGGAAAAAAAAAATGGGKPTSPRRSPRAKYGRSKFAGRNSGFESPAKLQRVAERLAYLLLSLVFRRHGVLLFAPLIYLSGMLLYMGTLPIEIPRVVHRPPPGSTYRSPQVFEKLWPHMQADRSQMNALTAAWHTRGGQTWKPCIDQKTSIEEVPASNGYLIIEANGGLNQQRISICDAVAVAGLLNATLVIPTFHLNSVWRDSSKFGDIFDEEHFIEVLKNEVKVVKELPEDVLQKFDNNISNITNLRVKAWSTANHYLEKVLPKLLKLGAVRIAPFSNRLANEVPEHIQYLRCLTNFKALRFSEPIRLLADSMFNRMVQKSSLSNGKYVSIHLRFEEDMVAFSCCIYDGGEEEKREMDKARERGWRGKFSKTGRIIRPGAIRMDGKCPLTPLEVGMMLRGMGFDNGTHVYVAAGKIYKAEKYMAPLQQMFPFLETKESLASEDELASFKGHSSRLAALDYTVCLHSEVFVTTQGGNFPHFLMGHRRYLYEGHAKTIKPDKRKLALMFDNPRIRWDYFKKNMHSMLHHSDTKGVEIRKPNSSLYTFPTPDCMCRSAIINKNTSAADDH